MPPEGNVAEIGQSYHALYHNVQVRRAYGYGVVDGGQVSPGSTRLSVDVDGGTALFDGGRQPIPSRTDLSIPSPDPSDPRKDLIVYDGNTVDVIVGTPQPAPSDQGSASRFELFQPSPPDTSTTPVVVLAELFVPAGASSLSPADVNDLRTDPSVDADRVSLPDDARLTLGDSDDFTVRYDSGGARLTVDTRGGNTFEYLNDGSLLIDGDLVAEGDVTFGGVFDPDTITPDVVDVGESLELPVYADNANATQDAAEVWFNDGTGPDAAGIYYFDGGVIGPLETGSGSSPGTLSGLTADVDAKDFGGATFTGMGHDKVDVPQVRELTVDDFERASLGSDYVGEKNGYDVTPSVSDSGGRSLRGEASAGNSKRINSIQGLSSYPQSGDTFSVSNRLTDSDDIIYTYFATTGDEGYFVQVNSRAGELRLTKSTTNGPNELATDTVTLSNHLNEWLTIRVNWGSDGEITATLLDSSGVELATATANDSEYQSGGIGFLFTNPNVAPTVYWDDFNIERREPEAAAATKKGRTTAGNNLTPTGGATTGPLEAPDGQHPERPVINVPVPSDLSAGDSVGYTFAVGEDRVATVEGEADGDGGTQNLSVNVNGALQAEQATVGTFGSGGQIFQTLEFSLSDEEQKVILPDIVGNGSFIITVSAVSENGAAVLAAAKTFTTILGDFGSFATSDTDGNTCVFGSGSDILLKNRLGFSVDYAVSILGTN